jgi:HAMP domain-containing protein
MGLRTRLLVCLLLPTVLTIGGFALWRTHEDQRAQREEFRQRRTVMTRAIEVAIDQALQAGSTGALEGLVRDLVVTQTYVGRVRLLDPSLRPVVDSSILTGYAGIPAERLRHVLETGQSEEIEHRWAGQALRSHLVPFHAGGTATAGVLEVVYLASVREVDIWTVASRWGLWAAMLFAVLAVVIAFVLQRQLFSPLAEITDAIRGFGRGEPHPRVPVRRLDELGRVAAALNDLTERLEAAQRDLEAETERSFNLEQQLRRSQTLALMASSPRASPTRWGRPSASSRGGRSSSRIPCQTTTRCRRMPRSSSPRPTASRRSSDRCSIPCDGIADLSCALRRWARWSRTSCRSCGPSPAVAASACP